MITVHQAIYGVADTRGHECLGTSLSSKVYELLQLTYKTDCLATLSSLSNWNPYYKGYCIDKYYCLMKTFPDTAQSRRGAVFTHVLILNKEDTEKINHLNDLLKLFKQKNEFAEDLKPIVLAPSISHLVDRTDDVKKILHFLIKKDDSPVVLIKYGNIENTLSQIWFSLPPKYRKDFTFVFSANLEQDIPQKTSPRLIYTFSEIVLNSSEYNYVHEEVVFKLTSPVESYIWDRANDLQYESFHKKIGYKFESFKDDLETLERAYELYKELETLSIEDLTTLIRKIGYLAPSSEIGKALKQEIAEYFYKSLQTTPIEHIKRLRTLKIDAFDSMEEILSPTITQRIKQHLKDELISKDSLSLFKEILISPNRKSWLDESVYNGIVLFFKNLSSKEEAKKLWEFWQKDVFFIKSLDKLILKRLDFEKYLILSYPSSKINHIDSIIDYCTHKKLFQLHATLMLGLYNPKKAFKAHISVDSSLDSIDGLNIIFPRLNDTDLILLFKTHQDSRLLQEITTRIASKPSILNGIEVKEKYWRLIWLNVIDNSLSTWGNIEDKHAILFSLFDLILNKEKAGQDIFQLVYVIGEKAPLEILDYNRRDDIWLYIENSVSKANFTDETIDGWYERAKKGNIVTNLEPFLRNKIFSSSNTRLNNFLLEENSINNSINLFEKFPSRLEYLLEPFLKKRILLNPNLDEITARRLGSLIAQKKFSNLHKNIVHHAKKSRLLDQCISQFYDLLGLRLKFSLLISEYEGKSEISKKNWWKYLKQNMTDLYSTNEDIKTIWTNAGGDEADLLSNDTVKNTWEKALRDLKKGKFQSITLKSLLEEVNELHKNNESIKIITKSLNQF